jgi:hypothetical protein
MNDRIDELLGLVEIDQKISKQTKFMNIMRQDSSLKITASLVDAKSPLRVEHSSLAQVGQAWTTAVHLSFLMHAFCYSPSFFAPLLLLLCLKKTCQERSKRVDGYVSRPIVNLTFLLGP